MKDLLEEPVLLHDAEETVTLLEKLVKNIGIGYKEVADAAKPLLEFSP